MIQDHEILAMSFQLQAQMHSSHPIHPDPSGTREQATRSAWKQAKQTTAQPQSNSKTSKTSSQQAAPSQRDSQTSREQRAVWVKQLIFSPSKKDRSPLQCVSFFVNDDVQALQ